jgi:ERCC4-type nuclease
VTTPRVTPAFLVTPYTVVIDTREQSPYAFAGLHADALQARRPLLVQTRRGALPAGDYSLEGFETRIALERKSLADLYHTLGQRRACFQRELERLAAYRFAAVIIEAEWSEVLTRPPARSRLRPKTIFRSVIAWQQRFPAVQWWLVPGRSTAEVTTLRILERFWKSSVNQTKVGSDPPRDAGPTQPEVLPP